MSIAFEVLGNRQRDNALWIRVDGGQQLHRYLFDCGEGCLDGLSTRDLLDLEAVFLSHLHMDHISGFDRYFRANYPRELRPNLFYGPPDCARILNHRLQGFLLPDQPDSSARWEVHEIHPEEVKTYGWTLRERFGDQQLLSVSTREGPLLFENEILKVEAVLLDHGVPSVGYVVREHPRSNIDMKRAGELGLRPGPWLRWLKVPVEEAPSSVKIGEQEWEMETLREALLVKREGDSIAYLTDFCLSAENTPGLLSALRGCKTLVCESQYAQQDRELALQHFHMTSTQVATLAKDAGVGELVVMHLSERYDDTQCDQILEEVRSIFPNARFPEHW